MSQSDPLVSSRSTAVPFHNYRTDSNRTVVFYFSTPLKPRMCHLVLCVCLCIMVRSSGFSLWGQKYYLMYCNKYCMFCSREARFWFMFSVFPLDIHSLLYFTTGLLSVSIHLQDVTLQGSEVLHLLVILKVGESPKTMQKDLKVAFFMVLILIITDIWMNCLLLLSQCYIWSSFFLFFPMLRGMMSLITGLGVQFPDPPVHILCPWARNWALHGSHKVTFSAKI